MAGPIRISILANAAQAKREFRTTANDAQKMGRTLEAVGKVGTKVRERLTGLAGGALKAAGAAAQLASTASAAAPVLAKAGASVLKVGQAAVQVAPAILAFAAAGLFVKLTFAQIGPAIVKSLSPITEGFKAAGVEAGKLATKGVGPLASAFNKLGMPIISEGMNRIAVSTNGVVKGFLAWAASKPGLTALQQITSATATAFEKVAPHVLALGTALGELIGRIANVSLSAGSKGLVGVLDKVTEKLKTISAADVQEGLTTLKDTFTSIKDAVAQVGDFIAKAIGFYRQYKTEINLLADAFAVFTIIFGGPVVAIVAAVGILIRHFDLVKEGVARIKEAFTSPMGSTFMDTLRAAADEIWPKIKEAFNQIKNAVLPVLKEIWEQIRTELIPAFLEFVTAVTPVVAFFVEKLGPIVATVMKGILEVVKGVIKIITGIFQVFTGVLTGDWSKCWEGIKNICKGAWQVVKSLVQTAFNLLKQGFSNAKSIVVGIWNGLWNLVKSAISSAKSAISSKLSEIVSAVRSKFESAKAAAKAKLDSLVSTVRSAIGRAKSAITSIDLFAAGAALIQKLINGIKSKIGAIGDIMGGIASKIGGFLPGSPIKTGALKGWNQGKAGARLMDLLTDGIRSRQRAVAAATSAAASVVAGGFTSMPVGALAGAADRSPVTINFNGLATDPDGTARALVKLLENYDRRNGRR